VEFLGQQHLQVVHPELAEQEEWVVFGELHQAVEPVEATLVVVVEEMTDAAPVQTVAVAVAEDQVWFQL
jgi:hypothetical protein